MLFTSNATTAAIQHTLFLFQNVTFLFLSLICVKNRSYVPQFYVFRTMDEGKFYTEKPTNALMIVY
jgi:hypothetical protein